MQIVKLSQEVLPVVAEWIHNAFWQDSGQPVAFIQGLLTEHLAGKPIPTTFVAVEDGMPIGSVCLIENDMAERPNITPWLAALYVRPAYRRRGVGSQLIRWLVDYAAGIEVDQVYLSTDDQIALYARHGFEIVETKIGPHKLTIMRQIIKKGEIA